jgi:hypothetical protein
LSLSLRSPHQKPVCTSPLSRRVMSPPPPIHPLDTGIIFDKQYRSWSSSLWSHLHSPVISSHLGPNKPTGLISARLPLCKLSECAIPTLVTAS